MTSQPQTQTESTQPNASINGNSNLNDQFRTQSRDEWMMLGAILFQSYGLSLTTYQRLGGYDDVNYHVSVHQDRHCNPEITSPSKDGYILRIVNAKDSQVPQRMEAINEVIAHAHKKGIFTQTTVANLQQQSVSSWTFVHEDQETVQLVCLRSFIPGKSLSDVTLTEAMLYKFGIFAAKLTQALKDFQHPFFENFRFSWTIDNIDQLKAKTQAVDDEKRRKLLEDVLEFLSTELFKNRRELETGQVHGDLTTRNIILQNPGGFTCDFSDWCLIDFYDTHRSCSLVELSTAACHLYQAKGMTCHSSLDAIGLVVNGYNSTIPIRELELDFIISSIKARLCIVLVNGYNAIQLNPENGDYIRFGFEAAWNLLEEIHHTPTREIIQKFQNMKKS